MQKGKCRMHFPNERHMTPVPVEREDSVRRYKYTCFRDCDEYVVCTHWLLAVLFMSHTNMCICVDEQWCSYLLKYTMNAECRHTETPHVGRVNGNDVACDNHMTMMVNNKQVNVEHALFHAFFPEGRGMFEKRSEGTGARLTLLNYWRYLGFHRSRDSAKTACKC